MSLIARAPKRETAQQSEGYDPARLRRAAVLAVTKLGPGLYRVKGQNEPYYDVEVSADVPCYCRDAEFHGKGCKHYLAARLHDGDGSLIMALGEILLRQAEANAALSAKRRKGSKGQ